MNGKEQLQQMATEELLNASSCCERGEIEEAKEHELAALMYELQSQATHKLDDGLYKVSGVWALLLDLESLRYVKTIVGVEKLTLINRG